jgi:hypothetical protein
VFSSRASAPCWGPGWPSAKSTSRFLYQQRPPMRSCWI